MSESATVGPDADIDPADYDTLASFKTAVYDEHGAGTWLDDMKLEIVWRAAHDEEIPDYLQPLLKEDDDDE